MAQPVNLNRVRKEKARADKKSRADTNAVVFGRTKAQKAAEKAQTETQKRALDQHKRDP